MIDNIGLLVSLRVWWNEMFVRIECLVCVAESYGRNIEVLVFEKFTVLLRNKSWDFTGTLEGWYIRLILVSRLILSDN